MRQPLTPATKAAAPTNISCNIMPNSRPYSRQGIADREPSCLPRTGPRGERPRGRRFHVREECGMAEGNGGRSPVERTAELALLRLLVRAMMVIGIPILG